MYTISYWAAHEEAPINTYFHYNNYFAFVQLHESRAMQFSQSFTTSGHKKCIIFAFTATCLIMCNAFFHTQKQK